ncbi:MAG: Pyruvate synthase subunit PorD [Syntrophus sp. PtaU1.Bin208]|nr:MAG: Pyruvate synthase subunit PorD [Syntrophus sp. PtaU1.Bin208]
MSRERQRLAISRPKEGAAGKTGSWRLFRPVVDREKCNRCGLCVLYCPDCAMGTDIEIDLEFCKGCGICANECPKKAIVMAPE